MRLANQKRERLSCLLLIYGIDVFPTLTVADSSLIVDRFLVSVLLSCHFDLAYGILARRMWSTYLSLFLAAIFIADSLRVNWDLNEPMEHCYSTHSFIWSCRAFHLISVIRGSNHGQPNSTRFNLLLCTLTAASFLANPLET